MIAWENEALLARDTLGEGEFEVVLPSLSMLAEPPVAVVDAIARRKGTRSAAEEYLNYLYSPEAQDLIGKHHYRPSNADVLAKYSAKFPKLDLVTIDAEFGGWKKAQAEHFADGAIFDQIYVPGR
jgi:sulfate transport system substrate-binding protein